jgi:dGTPase
MLIPPSNATCPRQITEFWEQQWLAPPAALSARSRGRERVDPPCPFRTEFQRDRDRILHCKAFRRLATKTQVFVQPRTDHDRTRLTHTLEVCQVARTIARVLRLNEDLTEAIALGHDLGHSPFGHAGEAALNEVIREYDSTARFHHSVHSLRVVDLLERDGQGLNLTWETRDGILHHSKGAADWPASGAPAATLEGQLVALCDRIAYSSHDIDDALRAGRLTPGEFPPEVIEAIGLTHSARLTAMVSDVIAASADLSLICMSPEMTAVTNQLKDFMYEHLYLSRSMAPDTRVRIHEIVTGLFHFYMACPEYVPGGPKHDSAHTLTRRVCDFIAGMTDGFAEGQYCTLVETP